MIGLAAWASVAAIVSAMADVVTVGRETFDYFLRQRLDDPDLPRKAAVLAATYSTYSDREIEAIRKRVENCRDRFIEEGSGEARKNCLCSVLRVVKDGNGGYIPVEEWQRAYNQSIVFLGNPHHHTLTCAGFSARKSHRMTNFRSPATLYLSRRVVAGDHVPSNIGCRGCGTVHEFASVVRLFNASSRKQLW